MLRCLFLQPNILLQIGEHKKISKSGIFSKAYPRNKPMYPPELPTCWKNILTSETPLSPNKDVKLPKVYKIIIHYLSKFENHSSYSFDFFVG